MILTIKKQEEERVGKQEKRKILELQWLYIYTLNYIIIALLLSRLDVKVTDARWTIIIIILCIILHRKKHDIYV